MMREFPGSPVAKTFTFTARAGVQPSVGELRSHKPHGIAKKKKKKNPTREKAWRAQGAIGNWEPFGLFKLIFRLPPPLRLKTKCSALWFGK